MGGSTDVDHNFRTRFSKLGRALSSVNTDGLCVLAGKEYLAEMGLGGMSVLDFTSSYDSSSGAGVIRNYGRISWKPYCQQAVSRTLVLLTDTK